VIHRSGFSGKTAPNIIKHTTPKRCVRASPSLLGRRRGGFFRNRSTGTTWLSHRRRARQQRVRTGAFAVIGSG